MNAEARTSAFFALHEETEENSAGGSEPLEDERQTLAARMTDKPARLLLDLPLRRVRRLEEMRFYVGQNACFIFDGRGETQHVVFFCGGTWTSW